MSAASRAVGMRPCRSKDRLVEMREQSQKQEMSEALRGDFRRLRARGVATTLGPVPPDETDGPAFEPAPASPVETTSRPEDAKEPKVTVLARLLGRR